MRSPLLIIPQTLYIKLKQRLGPTITVLKNTSVYTAKIPYIFPNIVCSLSIYIYSHQIQISHILTFLTQYHLLYLYQMGFPANGDSATDKPYKFLIYGRTGWIGGLLGNLCQAQGIDFVYGSGRLENRSSLEADIAATKPTHVFNAAGVTGRPNVDWCESHKVETIRTNVAGTLTLADVCRDKGIVLINYATGCIFEYDSDHPLGSGIGYKEEDTPNFIGSFYSKTKAMVLGLNFEFFFFFFFFNFNYFLVVG